MKWEIKKRIKSKTQIQRREEIVKALLNNRGITGRKVSQFLNPAHPGILKPEQVGISASQIKKSIKRIKQAIKEKENIIIYGDYDADGICSTAILWETLHFLGANAIPFIPHREKHGYGLSAKVIKEIFDNPKLYKLKPKPSLIITVDNGIVAHKAVDYAAQRNIDVIISDHHQPANKLPHAHSIVHTTKLAGAGVSWILAKEISKSFSSNKLVKNLPKQSLDLAAIGTISDMVPLIEANRSIVKFGLQELRVTERVGLLELFNSSAINPQDLNTYHISFVIAPRLNAMGRLEHALDSLRLLCTKSHQRAKELASTLGKTNRQRQEMTQEALSQAQLLYQKSQAKASTKLIIVEDYDFHEGIIGLVAGKLVEDYYRPAIVISKAKGYSKASARSIPGFNIIEAIRQTQHLLVDAGGHPMAAGFTIRTSQISSFKKSIHQIADQNINQKMLSKKLTLDCDLLLEDMDWKLLAQIENFKPFGTENPKPIFAVEKALVLKISPVGTDAQHLKMMLQDGKKVVEAIAFNQGHLFPQLNNGSYIKIAACLEKNLWRGKESLQLNIQDIKV